VLIIFIDLPLLMKFLPAILLLVIIGCHSKQDKGTGFESRDKAKKIVFPENHYLVNNGGCMYRDSLVVTDQGNGLFADKAGNLYFKTTDNSDRENPLPVLISRLYNGCDGDSAHDLKNHIDPASFTGLDYEYYKDKNSVFVHNAMSDGGNIVKIDGADAKTFRSLPSSWFGADKDSVYYKGSLLELADRKTFSCIYVIVNGDTGLTYFGKDKRYYFKDYDTCKKSEVDEYLREE
jgi:hypothetical protein